MFSKKNWQYCCHCEGTGVCKTKTIGIKKILGIPLIPIRTSDASCLAAAGADPSKYDLIVRCDICKGTGYVYLDKNGKISSQPKQ